jgi:hypothetical protein
VRVLVIPDHCGNPYLIRFTLLELWGFELKLHVILKSDDDRELHCHPWSFITWILSEGYYEVLPGNTRYQADKFWGPDATPEGVHKVFDTTRKVWHRASSIHFNRAPHPHLIELKDPKKPAVSLVFTWPRFRPWGFYTKKGWVAYDKYKREREC